MVRERQCQPPKGATSSGAVICARSRATVTAQPTPMQRLVNYLRKASTRQQLFNAPGQDPQHDTSDSSVLSEQSPLKPESDNGIKVTLDEPDDVFPYPEEDLDRPPPVGKLPFLQLVRKRFPYYVPIFSWLPKYAWKSFFVRDLIAGLGIASILIPQSLAYAGLAGLSPAFGLATAWFPLLIYFFLGTSRHLSAGPDALCSLLVGITIATAQDDSKINLTPEEMATVLSFASGLLCLALGLLRVGFLDNVLSRPLLCGFVNAVATTIILEQLDQLFGLPSDHEHGWKRLIHWIENVHLTHWVTLCMGIITIYIIFMIKFTKTRFSFMKFVPETMIVVIVGTLVTGLARLDTIGVSVLGEIAQGFPVPRPPRLDQFQAAVSLFPSAALIAIIGFIEHIVAAKVYATKHNYPISANRELVALGVTNTMGSFFSTYPTFASLTRSAVADSMGAQSQIYSFITSFVILFTMLFLGPLFYYLPKVVMAGIITSAAIGLFEVHDVLFLMKIRAWGDLFLLLLTYVLTIFLGVELGIGISLGISIFFVIKHTTVPQITILGKVPGTTKYKDVNQFKEAEVIPGVLMIRIEEPLYFANVQQYKSVLGRIERLGAPHAHPSESDSVQLPPLQCLIFHCAHIQSIDASAIDILKHMIDDYRERKVFVAFVKLRDELKVPFLRAGIIKGLDGHLLFNSMQEAVDYMRDFVAEKGSQIYHAASLHSPTPEGPSSLPLDQIVV